MIIIHKQNIFDLFNEQNPPAAVQPSEIVQAPTQPDNVVQAPATDPIPNTQPATKQEPDNAADQPKADSNIEESEVNNNVKHGPG